MRLILLLALVSLVGLVWAADTGDVPDTGAGASPSAGADAKPAEERPVSVAEPEVPPTGAVWRETDDVHRRWEDVDHDGTPDAVEESSSGGSGFHGGRTCARVANGHVACRSWADTAYSRFYGVAVEAVSPTTGNTAAAALSVVCAAADERSPAQGVMWRLLESGPWPADGDAEGDEAKVLLTPAPVVWRRGPVVAQTRVCLDGPLVEGFRRALSWGGGEPLLPGWQVAYDGMEFTEVLRDKRQVIFATRHALAVYDVATDQHAWFVQLEGTSGLPFKYDRWDAIEGVSWSEPGVVDVSLNPMLMSGGRMRVKVPRP